MLVLDWSVLVKEAPDCTGLFCVFSNSITALHYFIDIEGDLATQSLTSESISTTLSAGSDNLKALLPTAPAEDNKFFAFNTLFGAYFNVMIRNDDYSAFMDGVFAAWGMQVAGENNRAPSQYKDRLSQVWGFPC